MLFSVVIPSYDRWPALQRALLAYEQQQPAELAFEVIVVDDGSGDETASQLAEWRSDRYRFRFFAQENSGPARARNHALEHAAAPLIFFSGDDIEPTERLLDQHWKGHVRRPDEGLAVLGLTRWSPRRAQTATMRHVDGVGAQQFGYHWMQDGREYDFRHFYTSNISVRKRLLDRESTYFSEEFPLAAWEDTELAYRLQDHGLRIRYCESALAFHDHVYSARSFYRRQVRAGRMARILSGKYPELVRWTGLDELERIRVRWLGLDEERQASLERVRSDLESWVGRALALASFFDPHEVEGLDGLLIPLFRYAVYEGLCSQDGEDSTAILAAAYLDLIQPAVSSFRRVLESSTTPFPMRDILMIESLRDP